MEKELTLNDAIEVLCRVHTREDPDCGFTVESCAPINPWDYDRYVPAWAALIKHRDEARTRGQSVDQNANTLNLQEQP
jgi:hypothetical protein